MLTEKQHDTFNGIMEDLDKSYSLIDTGPREFIENDQCKRTLLDATERLLKLWEELSC